MFLVTFPNLKMLHVFLGNFLNGKIQHPLKKIVSMQTCKFHNESDTRFYHMLIYNNDLGKITRDFLGASITHLIYIGKK